MTMNMKYLSACLAALILSLSAYAETESASLPVIVESFPLSDVRLTGGQFKHAEDMDIRYLLALDPDRLLAPYRKGAGLEPKAENYTNWENTGLDGHIGGHYLSALSYMFAATGNREIGARLDYVLSVRTHPGTAISPEFLTESRCGRKYVAETYAPVHSG